MASQWRAVTALITIVLAIAIAPFLASSREVGQEIAFMFKNACSEQWNLFHHLGGNGPWVPYKTDIDIDLGSHCSVSQVHILSRHASRYPTKSVGMRIQRFQLRIRLVAEKLRTVLPFLNEWPDAFPVGEEIWFENLTRSGEYSGVKASFEAGMEFRDRYKDLIDNDDIEIPSIFSCSCTRVLETAKHFAAGFYGIPVDETVRHVVVPDKDYNRGGDTLTPVKQCRAYLNDHKSGRKRGYDMLQLYKNNFLNPIAERLNSMITDDDERAFVSSNEGKNDEIHNKNIDDYKFTNQDIWTMFELCGFEILIRGTSPWCDIFMESEWEQFEYARDLLHYYRTGPGTPYSKAMGFLYLNATTRSLISGPDLYGRTMFSFAHDGDIIPLLSVLGVLDEENEDGSTKHLSEEKIMPDRKWKLSTIVPMLGRIAIERITCLSTDGMDESIGVRLLINDGVVRLAACDANKVDLLPNGTCPIEIFEKIVSDIGHKIGSFEEACDLDEREGGHHITFLKQEKHVNPGEFHLRRD
ncbi:histidine phosphatase superfamily [Dipodascopsis uninucleata]